MTKKINPVPGTFGSETGPQSTPEGWEEISRG